MGGNLVGQDAVLGITHLLVRLQIPIVLEHDLPLNIVKINSTPMTKKDRNWSLLGAHFNDLGLAGFQSVNGCTAFFENPRLMPDPQTCN
jgi:hypothetical protein